MARAAPLPPVVPRCRLRQLAHGAATSTRRSPPVDRRTAAASLASRPGRPARCGHGARRRSSSVAAGTATPTPAPRPLPRGRGGQLARAISHYRPPPKFPHARPSWEMPHYHRTRYAVRNGRPMRCPMAMSEYLKGGTRRSGSALFVVAVLGLVWPVSLLWRGARFIASRGVSAAARALARSDPTLDAGSMEVGLWLCAVLALPPVAGLLLVAPSKPGSWLTAVCGVLALPMFWMMGAGNVPVLWSRPARALNLGAIALLLVWAVVSKNPSVWILSGFVALGLCIQLAMLRGARKAASADLEVSGSSEWTE
jgi:hypothetical protein